MKYVHIHSFQNQMLFISAANPALLHFLCLRFMIIINVQIFCTYLAIFFSAWTKFMMLKDWFITVFSASQPKIQIQSFQMSTFCHRIHCFDFFEKLLAFCIEISGNSEVVLLLEWTNSCFNCRWLRTGGHPMLRICDNFRPNDVLLLFLISFCQPVVIKWVR